jgi:hypothetical protein
MQRPRALSLILASIAFAGWVLFILACTNWPGWSPDGKQVLFPYLDEKTEATGIALYDREQKTITTFYLGQTSTGSNEHVPAAAQWSQDGKQILLYQGSEDRDRYTMEVLSIPVEEKYPIRSLSVISDQVTDWPPLTEVKGTLYLGFNGLTALDLETWRKRQEPVGNFVLTLLPMGDRVLYVAVPQKEERKAETTQPQAAQAQSEKKEPPVPFEFGEIDQKDLSRHAWFTFTDQHLAEIAHCAAVDLQQTAAADAGAQQIAFTLTCPDKADAILLLDRSGIRQIVHPKTDGQFLLTDAVQWSRDGKTLYAGLYVPGEKQDKGKYSLAEIALDTEQVRLTPITRFDISRDDYRGGMRVSLSPDGSMIATSTALIDSDSDIEREDLALYIVALRDPLRSVTKVHPPNWTPGPAEAAPAAEMKKTP